MVFLWILSKSLRFNRFKTIIFGIVIAFIMSIVNMAQVKSLNLISNFTLLFLLSLCFYYPSKITNLFLTLLYIGFNFLGEYLYFWLSSSVLASFAVSEPEMLYYLSFLFSSLLNGCIVVTVAFAIKHKGFGLPVKTSRLFLIFPIASIAFIAALTFENPANIRRPFYILLLILLLFFNFLIFFAIDRYNHYLEERHKSAILAQALKDKEAYYAKVEAMTKETRKIRHDLKNQLVEIADLLPPDNPRARALIQGLLGEINRLETRVYTKNPSFNTVLAAKFADARQAGIPFDYHITLPETLTFEPGEIGVLLGNLLDNAIEASVPLPPKDRYLYVKILYEYRTLMVLVENGKLPNPADPAGTRKDEPQNHGFGLKSVAQLTDKYNGVLTLSDEGDRFIARFMLCDLDCPDEATRTEASYPV